MTPEEIRILAIDLDKCCNSVRELSENMNQVIEIALSCFEGRGKERFSDAYRAIFEYIDTLPEKMGAISHGLNEATIAFVYGSPDVMCIDAHGREIESTRKEYPNNWIRNSLS